MIHHFFVLNHTVLFIPNGGLHILLESTPLHSFKHPAPYFAPYFRQTSDFLKNYSYNQNDASPSYVGSYTRFRAGFRVSGILSFHFVLQSNNQQFRDTGIGTAFYQEGGAGSCGVYNSDDAIIAALTNFYMDNQSPSPYCGQQIFVTNMGSDDQTVEGQGNTLTVTVADTCPTCIGGQGSVDFSIGAWNKLTNNSPLSTFNVQW